MYYHQILHYRDNIILYPYNTLSRKQYVISKYYIIAIIIYYPQITHYRENIIHYHDNIIKYYPFITHFRVNMMLSAGDT